MYLLFIDNVIRRKHEIFVLLLFKELIRFNISKNLYKFIRTFFQWRSNHGQSVIYF